MAHDPYGYESQEPEQVAPTAPAAHWVAGINALVWAAAGLVWCLGCSGLFFPTFEPEADDGPFDILGVWTILMLPAYPLLGISLATVTLHGLARRWWTSVGPNIVLGGCGGLFVWVVVLLAVIIAAM